MLRNFLLLFLFLGGNAGMDGWIFTDVSQMPDLQKVLNKYLTGLIHIVVLHKLFLC